MCTKEFAKALNHSFLLLKYRARSRSEISLRLGKKGHNPSIVKQVINYLQENNYINDKDFTRLFISYSLEKGWGPRRIDFNLKKLGISCELRAQILNEGKVYRERIREIIKEKIACGRNEKDIIFTGKTRQKITRSLVAKGFDYEDILKEMENLGIGRLDSE